MRTGQEITLHIVEYLEGNSAGSRFVPRRLGFLTELELEFFELFCTVEKIGAKKGSRRWPGRCGRSPTRSTGRTPSG